VREAERVHGTHVARTAPSEFGSKPLTTSPHRSTLATASWQLCVPTRNRRWPARKREESSRRIHPDNRPKVIAPLRARRSPAHSAEPFFSVRFSVYPNGTAWLLLQVILAPILRKFTSLTPVGREDPQRCAVLCHNGPVSPTCSSDAPSRTPPLSHSEPS